MNSTASKSLDKYCAIIPVFDDGILVAIDGYDTEIDFSDPNFWDIMFGVLDKILLTNEE